jgi:hypothetical protein
MVLLAGACARLRPEDLRGEYVAEYAVGRERLTLLADGTYRQEMTVFRARTDDGSAPLALEVVTQQDRWTYQPGDGRDLGSVVLTNCLVLWDHPGHLREAFRSPTKGLCVCPVERRYVLTGSLCIASGEEERVCAVSPP